MEIRGKSQLRETSWQQKKFGNMMDGWMDGGVILRAEGRGGCVSDLRGFCAHPPPRLLCESVTLSLFPQEERESVECPLPHTLALTHTYTHTSIYRDKL